MSLVNEALKRTRNQAAIQQAANNPLSHITAPSHYSEPKKSYAPIILIGLFACAFVGLVSAAVVHLTKPSYATPDRSANSGSSRTPARARLMRVSMPMPPAAPAAPVSPAPAVAGPAALVAADTVPAAGLSPASEKSAPPAPIVSSPNLVEGKVYLQSLDFPDAPKLRLDGILWSDKNPIALINGIAAAPGDDLGGIGIVAIEPKRVKVAAQGKQFFVRLP